MPSVDLMTRFVPEDATATKTPFPKVTELHRFGSGADLAVQFIPSGEVIMRLDPTCAIATNKPLP
jgi:hypothetical protein